MMTLKEARRIQREREQKVILQFLVLCAVVAVASVLTFAYTNIIEISNIFYLLPFAAMVGVVRITEISKLFAPKEFIGNVENIDIYTVKSQRVKGERSYIQNEGLEAEILLRNKSGRTMIKVLPNGDITSRLCLGDEIAFLRFIDEPVVIKGAYLK